MFIITNLAIIFVLSIVLNLLGVDRILDEQGVGLDLRKLITFAAVFGFGGSFISLAISKWTAKLRKSANQPHLPDQMAAFGISGNFSHGLRRLFMTHPSPEERIEALRKGT